MGTGALAEAWGRRPHVRIQLPHASGLALTLLTHLCIFGSMCNVVCLVQREYARASLEYRTAANAYEDLCSDAVKKESYGRFHQCDEAFDAISISNVWLVALNRAISAFVNSIKTQTFDDLTHIGLITVLTGLAVCCALHVASYLMERWNEWAMMRHERRYQSAGLSRKHAAIKMHED